MMEGTVGNFSEKVRALQESGEEIKRELIQTHNLAQCCVGKELGGLGAYFCILTLSFSLGCIKISQIQA